MKFPNMITRKDINDSLKNWEILWTLLGVPIAVFFIMFLIVSRETGNNMIIEKILDPSTVPLLITNLNLNQYSNDIALYLLLWNTLYFYAIILFTFIIPSVLSATSITSEKEKMTIEILFTAPLTDRDFMLSKILACALPALLISFSCYILAIISTFFKYDFNVAKYFLGSKWLLLHLVIIPFYILIASCIGLIISILKNSSRSAIMISFFAVLPILLISIPFIYGEILFNLQSGFFAISIGSVLLLTLGFILKKLFNREKILLRYK